MDFFSSEIIQASIGIFLPFVLAPILSYGSEKRMYPWYAELKRPWWTPSDMQFCFIWLFLYTTMGYASYRVWKSEEENSLALIVYGVQLVVNVTWSQTFFTFHQIGWACVHMIVMWILVAILLVKFWSVDVIAGYLIVPYFMWMTCAINLSYSFWTLNCSEKKQKEKK